MIETHKMSNNSLTNSGTRLQRKSKGSRKLNRFPDHPQSTGNRTIDIIVPDIDTRKDQNSTRPNRHQGAQRSEGGPSQNGVEPIVFEQGKNLGSLVVLNVNLVVALKKRAIAQDQPGQVFLLRVRRCRWASSVPGRTGNSSLVVRCV